MKLKVTFKDPDGPYECIQDAAKAEVNAIVGVHEDEKEALIESRAKHIRKVTGKFFAYGEYCEIEIDTDAGTAIVVPCK